jgi:hypothetical protein
VTIANTVATRSVAWLRLIFEVPLLCSLCMHLRLRESPAVPPQPTKERSFDGEPNVQPAASLPAGHVV